MQANRVQSRSPDHANNIQILEEVHMTEVYNLVIDLHDLVFLLAEAATQLEAEHFPVKPDGHTDFDLARAPILQLLFGQACVHQIFDFCGQLRRLIRNMVEPVCEKGVHPHAGKRIGQQAQKRHHEFFESTDIRHVSEERVRLSFSMLNVLAEQEVDAQKFVEVGKLIP